MKKRSGKIRDCVGDLIDRVLSYDQWVQEPPPEGTLGAVPMQDAGPTSFFRMQLVEFQEKKPAVSKAIEDLRRAASSRAPVDIDARSTDYFWSIFPYREFEKLEELRTRPRRQAQRGPMDSDWGVGFSASMAGQIASELCQLKRFLKPPADWPESRLFKKEQIYAQKLATDPIFREAFWTFVRDRKSLLARRLRDARDGILWAEIAVIESVEAQYHGHEELPQKTRFMYDFSCLCRHFALAGMQYVPRDGWRLIAQRFSIDVLDGNTLTVKVPNYLEIDWARQLPADVVKVMQRRGMTYTTVRPRRISTQEYTRHSALPDPEEARGRYYQLVEDTIVQSGKPCMDTVYETFDDEFVITKKDDLDTVRRMCRKYLASIGVPPSRTDPKIQSIIRRADHR